MCVARCGTDEEIVGEARYVVNADGKSCNFAIVIADGWHKSGIAGLLMNALIGAARERGLETMESQILSWNTDMLRFARGLGFDVYLSRQESHAQGTSAVEIIETHMSYVFLADHLVYKLKKPVRYPFLDFRTLEARCFNCHEELRLNRRLARNVYLSAQCHRRQS